MRKQKGKRAPSQRCPYCKRTLTVRPASDSTKAWYEALEDLQEDFEDHVAVCRRRDTRSLRAKYWAG